VQSRASAQSVTATIDASATTKGNVAGMGRYISPGGKWSLVTNGGAQAGFQKIEVTLQVKTAGVWGSVAGTTNQAVTNGNNWTSGSYVNLQANTEYRLRMVMYYQQNLGGGVTSEQLEAFTDSTTIP
jgi:hypothetical protein